MRSFKEIIIEAKVSNKNFEKALDSYEERTISWFSGKTRNISKMSKEDRQDFYATLDDQLDSPEIDPSKLKFPSEFPYNGRIIFISNLPC